MQTQRAPRPVLEIDEYTHRLAHTVNLTVFILLGSGLAVFLWQLSRLGGDGMRVALTAIAKAAADRLVYLVGLLS